MGSRYVPDKSYVRKAAPILPAAHFDLPQAKGALTDLYAPNLRVLAFGVGE
jgi:hypothetical protein